MARTKKPVDPNAPKKPRKPAFHLNASQKKLLKAALEAYAPTVINMPEHPLVDHAALIGDFSSMMTGFGFSVPPQEPQKLDLDTSTETSAETPA